MTMNRSIRIVLILGMIAVMCGTVSAATSIGATNENPGVGSPNACTAPCECISMNEAAQRWGAEGYETCSKSICGQSANAMTQYYCIHQIGGSTSAAVTTCQAPCECLSESGAIPKWGTNGYTQCTKTTCGTGSNERRRQSPATAYRQFGSTLLIGGATTKVPTAAATIAQTAAVQQTVHVTGPDAGADPGPEHGPAHSLADPVSDPDEIPGGYCHHHSRDRRCPAGVCCEEKGIIFFYHRLTCREKPGHTGRFSVEQFLIFPSSGELAGRTVLSRFFCLQIEDLMGLSCFVVL